MSEKDKKQQVIYADGCYDLFHSGHARQLEQAKKSNSECEVKLIVGISGFEETEEKKGRMLLNDKERYEILSFCRYVDDIILPCPWECSIEFLQSRGIDKIAHDAIPYSADGSEDIYHKFKQRNMFLETQRTEGISTTDLIVKIIRDRKQYQLYLLKNHLHRSKVGLNYFQEKKLTILNFLSSLYSRFFNNSNKQKSQKNDKKDN